MNVDSPDKIYDEISDFASLTSQMDTFLEEFNQMSKTPMSLVMFKFAIEHISRVSRVLKQDNGHLLLVGTFIELSVYTCNVLCLRTPVSTFSNWVNPYRPAIVVRKTV